VGKAKRKREKRPIRRKVNSLVSDVTWGDGASR